MIKRPAQVTVGGAACCKLLVKITHYVQLLCIITSTQVSLWTLCGDVYSG